MNKFLIILILIINDGLLAQAFIPAKSNTNVDSLISNFPFLRIYHRSNVELSFNFISDIDKDKEKDWKKNGFKRINFGHVIGRSINKKLKERK